jgi:hypothetical protein
MKVARAGVVHIRVDGCGRRGVRIKTDVLPEVKDVGEGLRPAAEGPETAECLGVERASGRQRAYLLNNPVSFV